MKALSPLFASILLAELGDKTRLFPLLLATDSHLSRIGVFVAASVALVLNNLFAVVFT